MGLSIRFIVLSVFLFQASSNVFPETISQSTQLTPEEETVVTEYARVATQPVHSLEYKPIRPSYLGSGSNVAQIVPPGKPWPASAAGYEDFSQVTPLVSTQNVGSNGGAITLTSPIPSSSGQVIKLDFSRAGVDAISELQTALAPQLANANIPSSQQRVIPYSLEITPPANSGQEFIASLQSAIKTVVSKLAPTAGSQMQIRMTKTASGTIVAVKLSLNVIIPAATQTLTPSNVPEINLKESSAGLSQSLITIILNELSRNGYVAGSDQVQKFNLAFSVLPPAGASKDYVKLNVLKPLQAALRQVAPGASLTSVSVNTQERGNEILRQIVNFSVQVNPAAQPTVNGNVINIPSIDFSQSWENLRLTLQNAIGNVAAINPSQQKDLVIPFRIKSPQAATKEQIQELYINPLQKLLSQVNPNGAVTRVAARTNPDGELLITFYYTLPGKTTESIDNRDGEIDVKVPATSESSNDISGGDIDINISPTESIVLPKTEDLIPKNAVTAPLVDLTKPGASLNDIQVSLDNVLSPSANPEPSKPKNLAIPIQIKPPTGATPEQVQKNVVRPIEQLLEKLEPTGKVLTSATNNLPNGDLGTVVYFGVPSVEKTNTYKNIVQKQPVVSKQDINLDKPGTTVTGEVSKALVSSLVINPKEKDKSAIIDMNVYTPPNSSPSRVQSIVDDITSDLKKQEPTGEIVTAKVNQNPSQYQPDAVVSYFVPSIKDSKTAQNAKNGVVVPTIDINEPRLDLVEEIQDVIKNNADKMNPDGMQLFNMNFKMNPFNEKGSIDLILKSLKAADPDGNVANYKIRTGDDGLEYLDVIYVVKRKQKPVTEAVIDINARNPLNNLLENVVKVVGSAVDNLKGVAQKGQIVDIPLNFRLTNSENYSDSQISQIISQFYPSLKSYIGQALPNSQILSANTYCPPNSDDVYLRTVVRARYDPDDVIIIEEVHKKARTTTTERTGIFGFKIFS